MLTRKLTYIAPPRAIRGLLPAGSTQKAAHDPFVSGLVV